MENQNEDTSVQDNSQQETVKETSIDISTLNSEQIREKVEAGELQVDDVIKYTEDLEAQHKTSLNEKDQTILNDRLRKLEKLQRKAQPAETVVEQPKEIAVEDLLTLRDNKFAKDSEEAVLLKRQIDAGMFEDYETAMQDVGIKASLDVIRAKREAVNEVDENANQDTILQTKNSIMENYQRTGKDPDSTYEKQVVLEKGLEQAGFREY